MVTVPRPIKGSIGSRIRVVFGETGKEWLLLLNHDNGDTKWQDQQWNNIPTAVDKQIKNCLAKDRIITSVDFGPDGTWFISGEKADGSAGHSWWGGTSASESIKENIDSDPLHVSFGSDNFDNETYVIVYGRNGYEVSGNLDSDVLDTLKKMNRRCKKIYFVRLFDRGQYFISHQEGTEWVLHNNNITKELKKNGKVNDLAVAGDGSWVIIREDSYSTSFGVDKRLEKELSKFFSDQRRSIIARKEAIREANEFNERARLARERAAEEARIEAAARQERERQAREAAEREERERMEREAAQRAARERARREAEHDAAAQASATMGISSLHAALEKRLIEEAADIKDMEEMLRNRKRSLQETLQSMPPETQSRINTDNATSSAIGNDSRGTCVICQDGVANIAVIPCGHLCLCSSCANSLNSRNGQRNCPLCRGNLENLCRIYSGN